MYGTHSGNRHGDFGRDGRKRPLFGRNECQEEKQIVFTRGVPSSATAANNELIPEPTMLSFSKFPSWSSNFWKKSYDFLFDQKL